jgi:kynurenine formamidase
MSMLLDSLARGCRVYDLAQPLETGIPCSPNHPGFRMALIRRHGDGVREDGGSAANEIIVTGGHVGTHVDALGHVSHEGLLHGGFSAAESQTGGRLRHGGIEELEPLIARGVLLDVAGERGVDVLAGSDAIEVADLERTVAWSGVEIHEGDVALIRTGWGRHFGDPTTFLGHDSGVPGPTEEAARWLADRGIRATGSDTTAYEYIPPRAGHRLLPVHRLLLVERGIHIIEMLNLEGISSARLYRFAFVLAPLKLVGATGSPVRPLALSDE